MNLCTVAIYEKPEIEKTDGAPLSIQYACCHGGTTRVCDHFREKAGYRFLCEFSSSDGCTCVQARRDALERVTKLIAGM